MPKSMVFFLKQLPSLVRKHCILLRNVNIKQGPVSKKIRDKISSKIKESGALSKSLTILQATRRLLNKRCP